MFFLCTFYFILINSLVEEERLGLSICLGNLIYVHEFWTYQNKEIIKKSRGHQK